MKLLKNNWHIILAGLALIIVVIWAIRAGMLINSDTELNPATRSGAINSLLGSIVALLTLIVTIFAFSQNEQTIIQNIHFKNFDVLKEEIQSIESKILSVRKVYNTNKGQEEYKGQHGINDIITTVVNYWEEIRRQPYSAYISESETSEVVTILKRIRKCYERIENKELQTEHRGELFEKADTLILDNLVAVFDQNNPLLLTFSHIDQYPKESLAKDVSLELIDEYAHIHRIYLQRKKYKGELTL